MKLQIYNYPVDICKNIETLSTRRGTVRGQNNKTVTIVVFVVRVLKSDHCDLVWVSVSVSLLQYHTLLCFTVSFPLYLYILYTICTVCCVPPYSFSGYATHGNKATPDVSTKPLFFSVVAQIQMCSPAVLILQLFSAQAH